MLIRYKFFVCTQHFPHIRLALSFRFTSNSIIQRLDWRLFEINEFGTCKHINAVNWWEFRFKRFIKCFWRKFTKLFCFFYTKNKLFFIILLKTSTFVDRKQRNHENCSYKLQFSCRFNHEITWINKSIQNVETWPKIIGWKTFQIN